ncbi:MULTISPECIES: LytR/AlgR family response regulator transcription factor [Clostridia]|jgi:two-component system response regulator AgrA|uniref:Stage 0 sporulation protein A homolog n=1 Tax=Clostridium saudiense TaxID=1414720 RepID=A0ABS2FI31_9CLOT|nr:MULTISPECIES: LytTR family DNA-binding domain-containing protein [Clostridiaceae]MBM6819864.1 response regulator transcription factor [Clostridium saudiense]
MLKIYICEDEYYQKIYLEKIITRVISSENYDMEISLITNNPHTLLDHIKDTKHTGIYFLDTHFKSKIKGIELAKKIRDYDPRCFIVFITADKDENRDIINEIFFHKIEVMDYIIKNNHIDLPLRIEDCLHNAYNKCSLKNNNLQKIFSAKIKDRILKVNYDNILFFETSPNIHKILLHYDNKVEEFYGKMKELEKILDSRFFRSHNSFILNMDKIKEVDKKARIAYLVNNKKCLISARKINLLLKY